MAKLLSGTSVYGNINIQTYVSAAGNVLAGNVSASANVVGGNIATVGTISAGGLVTVASVLGNSISTAGNIAAGYFFGNGSGLTGVTATSTGFPVTAGTSNIAAASNGNIAVTVSAVANVAVFTPTGVSVAGNITASGNVTAGNVNSNLYGVTVSASGSVYGATANISGNVTAGNVNSNVYGVTVSASGSLYGATANITGNITGGNLKTNSIYTINTGDTLTVNAATISLNPTANVSLNSRYINSLADPVAAQDAATKNYVDTVAQGLDPKASVVYATTGNLFTGGGYTYNNGTSGVGATLTAATNRALSIDGQTPSVGQRILVKNEVGTYVDTTTQSAAFNGIYTVTTVGSGTVPWVITRATDMDQWAEVPNAFTFVEDGPTNADTGWVCTSNQSGTMGTTSITWTQFSGAGTYTAGNALSLVGTQFNVNYDGTTISLNGTNQLYIPAGATLTTPNIGAATGTSLSVSGAVTSATITATGNISAGNVNSNLFGVTVSASGTVYGASHVGTTVSASGNVYGNSILGNVISITGNITTGNVTTGNITATGNILVASATGNVISTAGNVSAGYFYGNGSLLTGIITSVSNINNGQSNVTISGANANVTVGVSTVGNVAVFTPTGQNVTGNISATGNITANSYLNLANGVGAAGTGAHMTYNTSLQSIDFTFS